MKQLLPLLPRPSRYVGSEWGAVRKDPASVRVHCALAFPDLYEIGMSYLGQKILLTAVNSRGGLYAERVFAPCPEAAGVLRTYGARLATLETDTDLCDLDAVAFSLTHELCYTNVLYMLDLGGIPLHARDRGPGDPLVLAGGGACFNAEPLAAFVDVMVIGDGERTLPEALEILARSKAGTRADDKAGPDRQALLRELTRLPGVYVPSFFDPRGPGRPVRPLLPGYERVERAVLPDIETAPYPTRQAVPYLQTVHDRLTLEVARGCTRGCRFCQAGMIYRPVRERSLPRLHELLMDGLAATGYGEVSFLSLSTGDYSSLAGLMDQSFDHCAAEQVAISLPSLRVGSLSPEIMRLISSIRRTGATIAPEAGSQRLRDVINKGVTEAGLLAHVGELFAAGWQQVKLYFMIGLPTETEEDLRAIVELCEKVRDAAGRSVRRLQVTAAISPFVPKPHTPFQWERQLGLEEIRERIALLISLFKGRNCLRLKFHQPEMSFIEGVFSRGDRRLAPVIETAYRAGALFSSWKDHLQLPPYLEALAKHGLTPEEYLAPRDPDAALPWDHLLPGPSRGYLKAERARALRGIRTEDCRFGDCTGCGICNFDGRTSTLPAQAAHLDIRPRPAAPAPNRRATEAPNPNLRADLGAKTAHYRVWIEKTGAAAYLSQLELQTTLERALRRARVPLSFSEGFHPLPRLSFGRALPVGVRSLCEWFTLYLREDLPPERLTAALGPQLPPGLGLIRAERVSLYRKQPQTLGETYRLRLRRKEDRDVRLAQWQGALAATELPYTRRTKRGEKAMDLRPLLVRAEAWGEDAIEFELDWGTDYVNPLILVRILNPGLGILEMELTKIGQRLAVVPGT